MTKEKPAKAPRRGRGVAEKADTAVAAVSGDTKEKPAKAPRGGRGVAERAETAVAAVWDDMEQDAKHHAPSFPADMLVIPRVKVLNDLNPQVKEGNAEYVPGAKVGMILNELIGTLDSEIVFTPADFNVRYVAWRPRVNGGGLVDPNLTQEEVEGNFTPVKLGTWTGLMTLPNEQDPVRVEVHQTPEFIGIAKGAGWGPMPVAISMPSTKVKAAKRMNTAISLLEVPRKDGSGTFCPPMFYHQFALTTAIERSGDHEWFGFVVRHLGVPGRLTSSDSSIDEDLISRAKDLKLSISAGKVQVDSPSGPD